MEEMPKIEQIARNGKVYLVVVGTVVGMGLVDMQQTYLFPAQESVTLRNLADLQSNAAGAPIRAEAMRMPSENVYVSASMSIYENGRRQDPPWYNRY